jgi:hypothetical protein
LAQWLEHLVYTERVMSSSLILPRKAECFAGKCIAESGSRNKKERKRASRQRERRNNRGRWKNK